MELRVEFNFPCVRAIWRPDDGSVGLRDTVPHRLRPCGRARADAFVVAVDWPSCWMDLCEWHLQLTGASASAGPPMAREEPACWNYPAWRSSVELDNHANLADK